jgi:hypothetical protein
MSEHQYKALETDQNKVTPRKNLFIFNMLESPIFLDILEY